MEALPPASAAGLPPLGELLAVDPFWPYPAWGLAREGASLVLLEHQPAPASGEGIQTLDLVRTGG